MLELKHRFFSPTVKRAKCAFGAIALYGIPFGFLVLQFLLNTVSDFNFQPFLALFGVTFLPLSIMGIIFTKRGFALASSIGDREKKDVGYANFLLGALLLGITIFGFAVVYIMR